MEIVEKNGFLLTKWEIIKKELLVKKGKD